jgi:FdhD protein
MHNLLARRRSMSGRTGCGVCGIEDLEALERAQPVTGGGAFASIAIEAVARALADLPERQALGRATGATHAAAFADREGAIMLVREDVGRHNALDKLVGAVLRNGLDPAAGFVVVTSRCSFEMVEKAASLGARLIVAISAPTSLAIERARALGVALVAIARRDTVTVFHGAEALSYPET